MRDIEAWKHGLVTKMSRQWPEDARLRPAQVCGIELGFYLLSQVAPDEPADALWALLSGFPLDLPAEQAQMVGNARHLLTAFKSRYQWNGAIKEYRRLPDYLRGYDLDPHTHRPYRRVVTLCADRFDVYTEAARTSPPFATRKPPRASAGKYTFQDEHKLRHSVTIDPPFVFPAPDAHNLTPRTERAPISVSLNELRQTAHWMDTVAPPAWRERVLAGVRLELFGAGDTLSRSDTLTLDRLVHLVGMVSSGKSTLMDVLAAHLARRGYHVTIIASDVVSALGKAHQFTTMGLKAAPILGASTREQHVDRLHLALADEQPGMPWEQTHSGFRWISTACPLDGLREDPESTLDVDDYPCTVLYPTSGKTAKAHVCPMFARCPYHQAQRDLVDASIWIATPESLVYSRVELPINAERICFAELVYRHSDLVVSDEADLIQVRLDGIFSLSETLTGSGRKAWLNRVGQRVQERLHQAGHSQAVHQQVKTWTNGFYSCEKLVINLVHLLSNQPDLKRASEYFSDWTLFEELARALGEADRDDDRGEGADDQAESERGLRQVFSRYVEAPLGEPEDGATAGLCSLTRRLVADDDEDEEQILARTSDWIRTFAPCAGSLPDKELEYCASLLQFALIVTLLQSRLHILIRDWNVAQEPLDLESSDVSPFTRPPQDYTAVLPASPMGNVLVFQYNRSRQTQEGAGELRFLRCMGIGRWLLLHFHDLFASDSIAGPHVLLMSGTSWAGRSPSYHLQVPVAGILRAPDDEIKAIRGSQFTFTPVGNPAFRISGAEPGVRQGRLDALLKELASPQSTMSLRDVSWLEQQRAHLPAGRQNLLLVVGSYDECAASSDTLRRIRSDWQDAVIPLVRDSDTEEDAGLRRGRVGTFHATGAWMLTAPLLAIERGHNILNPERRAAMGAALFLVRPHPRPDDVSYAVHSINAWAVSQFCDGSWRAGRATLCEAGNGFRDQANRKWRRLLKLPVVYTTLPPRDRELLTWNSLVTILQVVGRLVRGGCPAEVFFCDAAFKPRAAAHAADLDTEQTSLLLGFETVLRPYFDPHSGKTRREQELVKALYGPFYEALRRME